MSPALSIFSRNLIKLLQDLRVSQAELARKIGVKPPVVARLLTPLANPQVSTITAIGQALGVSPARLLATEPERRALAQSALADPVVQINERLARIEAILAPPKTRSDQTPPARDRVIAMVERLPPDAIDAVEQVLDMVRKGLEDFDAAQAKKRTADE